MIPHAGEVAAAASVVAALACGGSWEIAGAAMATQRRSLAAVPGSSAPAAALRGGLTIPNDPPSRYSVS